MSEIRHLSFARQLAESCPQVWLCVQYGKVSRSCHFLEVLRCVVMVHHGPSWCRDVPMYHVCSDDPTWRLLKWKGLCASMCF